MQSTLLAVLGAVGHLDCTIGFRVALAACKSLKEPTRSKLHKSKPKPQKRYASQVRAGEHQWQTP